MKKAEAQRAADTSFVGATGAGPCPQGSASPLSKLVFHWIQPVFTKGYKQPLTMDDLWEVPTHLEAASMANKFEGAWESEITLYHESKKGTPNAKQTIDGTIMRSALWKLWKAEVLPLSFLYVLSQLCNVLSPFMQELIISFVEKRGSANEQPVATGVGYAMGLFALQLVGTLLSNHFQQAIMQKSMAIRTMITTTIYRKSLKLSPTARAEFGSGQIINLITTDTMRVQFFMMQVLFIFVLPLILTVNIAFLIYSIGWAAVIGISLLPLAIPVQAWLFTKMKVIRKKQAPITDQRVKKTTEILNGIRVIKLFSWESSFADIISAIRKDELVQVLTRSVYQAFVTVQAQTIPVLCTCVSFIAYGLLNPLSASKVFSSMSWFNQLRMPMWMIPAILNSWAEFNVALTRIESLLLASEIDEEYAVKVPKESIVAVQIENGKFAWNGPVFPDGFEKPKLPDVAGDKKARAREEKKGPAGKERKGGMSSDSPSPTRSGAQKNVSSTSGSPSEPASEDASLTNINISIKGGSLTAIVGPVGSGKSSLLNAIIGEMRKLSGKVSLNDTVAYAAQSAWIQNATVKDNIIFGSKFDKSRYLEVLYNAALLPDLKILKDKDQTSIGERGINLSGGQKQRINIARLMYHEAKIVLLDDPLSAVDAHVGRHLFEKCIKEAMKDRTRILVTHQLHYLPQCDNVIYVKDGTIVEHGSFADLISSGGEFSQMFAMYGGSVESEDKEESVDEDKAGALLELEKLTAPNVDASNIMTKEDQAVGGVSAAVWWRYIVACGGIPFLVITIIIIVLNEAAAVVNNLWLSWWTSFTFSTLSNTQYALIYLALALFSALTAFMYSYYFAFTGTRASKIMHEKALERILRAPVFFFDTTPVGRIINRFSGDVDALDNSVALSLRQLASSASQTLSTFIVMCAALPIFIAAVIPAMIVYWFVQDVYRRAARELKRLASTSRSPLYNNFGETLLGVATIRAYQDQERFIRRNDMATDVSNSPNYYLSTAGNWLSIRLQLLGSVLVAVAALLGITSTVMGAALFGLCLTYSLSVTQTLANLVQVFTQCEIAMNSAERVEHYGYRVEIEKDDGQKQPPPQWPHDGSIHFENVTMRYSKNLPVVLDNISFDIRNKEKVGIVGRTGSGKSSLMQALFRICEIEGSIKVDGIDSQQISLKNLRTSLAIIPQDPVVFSGTFRSNLSPFSEYSDSDIWDALERAGLKKKVMCSEGKLDGKVEAGGENLSVGERQLLCLARAMLKKPKILIMDEATANVDMETDAQIQKALREDFGESTILTIAHRLNTIIDYDRVLVLDHGKVAEYDTPRNLLANEEGIFYSLIMQTGEANAETLKKLVA
ncbi:P-loop containing nucleoside triphosphate hydrolase protein [Chytriomyces sp. MP71]|nr:P-loop containing nucleoside triphosphate hydrolase protein [Chytriomyces sp. MP71]